MPTKTHTFIHTTAVVSEKAKIGDLTKIWINVQVREDAEIGCQCIISKDVYIDHAVKIGDRCKIQNSVSIYNGVTIEDDVFIGPNVAFTNDKVPRAFNAQWKVTNTIIRKGASIGANATVLCGIEVGKYSMIGAGSVVTKDVPDHTLVAGNPAKALYLVCRCGHKLNEKYVCIDCGEILESAYLRDIK